MTAAKTIKYTTAKASPLYRALVEAAVERLTDKGSFSKVAILRDTNYSAVGEEAFNWEFIVRMIEEEGGPGTQLIKMAATFFKRHSNLLPPEQFPQKYIAIGHGKKTEGYCIASEDNGHFVIRVLNLKTNGVIGKMVARNTLLTTAQQTNVVGVEGSRPMTIGYGPDPSEPAPEPMPDPSPPLLPTPVTSETPT